MYYCVKLLSFLLIKLNYLNCSAIVQFSTYRYRNLRYITQFSQRYHSSCSLQGCVKRKFINWTELTNGQGSGCMT